MEENELMTIVNELLDENLTNTKRNALLKKMIELTNINLKKLNDKKLEIEKLHEELL